MANDKGRGELIAKEVEEINRRIRTAEISALNIDQFVDDTVEAVAEAPAPVTLPELERAIVQSKELQGKFEPHPEIGGAHYLDWHGMYQAVTFNPDLFDKHPNTLQLLTYGGGLLEQVLQAVDPPIDGADRGEIVRCSQTAPWPMVGFFGVADGQTVRSLSELKSVLDNAAPAVLADCSRQSLVAQFSAAADRLMSRENEAVRLPTEGSYLLTNGGNPSTFVPGGIRRAGPGSQPRHVR